MLTVLDFLDIRKAHAAGESIRSIASRQGHCQKSVGRAIRSETGEPLPYTRTKPVGYPKLGEFVAIKGQEKSDVERSVFALERRACTPVAGDGEADSTSIYIEQQNEVVRGTGKTHVAVALGQAACRAGKRVKFYTAATLVNHLEEAQRLYRLERMLSMLNKIDLLIVDVAGPIDPSMHDLRDERRELPVQGIDEER